MLDPSRIMQRCDALARHSELPGGLTRVSLHRGGGRLPFAIEVVGFCDEQGVRFGTTLLGSRVVAGTLVPMVLEVTDAEGRTIAQALRGFGLDPDGVASVRRKRGEVLAYAELHTGTVPMKLRRDALAAAAEYVLAVKRIARARPQVAGSA